MMRYMPKLSLFVLYPSAGATNEPDKWAAGHVTASFELLKPTNIKGQHTLLSIDIITFFINILAGEIVKRTSE
jgi:hypothetical protein